MMQQATSYLSEIDESPPPQVFDSMQSFLKAIVNPHLFNHPDRDVKLLLATCFSEITRITSPKPPPYNHIILNDIFRLFLATFTGLNDDTTAPSFARRVVILDTLAKYRSCLVLLDLNSHDLVYQLFRSFFAVASDAHPENVLSSMQTIMVLLLEESEDVREDILLLILSMLGPDNKNVSKAARKLAMNVIEQCAGKLEAEIKQFLISSMTEESNSENDHIDYHQVIYDIYCCAPQILTGLVSYITGELLTDQLDIRVKAVKLVGNIFSLPGSSISEAFLPVFSEFLKRLTDRVVEVRLSVLEYVKSCMLSDPSRAEAPQIISALCDRLLDYDENVRKLVVTVICDVACHDLSSIPVETIKMVAERLRDKVILVKKYTMERLAEIFKVYCIKCSDGSVKFDEFDWIPGKILRCLYDKDFRSDTIEYVLSGSLFPEEFSIKDKVKHWVRVYSGFDKIEAKALEKILEQKQRLQQEMQRYLSFRQMLQDGDTSEVQKKILYCFRIMSRFFAEPTKAEENFLILHQLKDSNIWKILTNLLDAKTSFHQAYSSQGDLLKILGEKHRLYEFLCKLSVKCSYMLFNKEHMKEILLEAGAQNPAGDTKYIQSCMDLLVTLARFSPLLLGGSEDELVKLLNNENKIIKEGVLHVLAKAGGTIREKLSASPDSLDLVLEKLCLEGSRKQAKHAVHALAAITKDDGLKSLSVLYKKLVDMLEEKTHLPAVLQSLGCIAQTAMPVFETREIEIQDFIRSKILGCSDKVEGNKNAKWDDRSETCLSKIYGIKTLVKSYLPTKDALLCHGTTDNLLGILRSILTYGEISKDIDSSSVDKDHLRLACAKAVLRLSRQWDDKLPIDIFLLTLRTSEISFPEARKLFLNKVHQYIKERVLDGKYACAFFFSSSESKPLENEEEKHNLADIIQMYHQTKARQISMQTDASSTTAYPEYILPYLVHALAHHSCPNVEECKNVEAYEPLYRKLYIMISMLVHKEEDVKSEGGTTTISKESLLTVMSIFKTIKCSEDAFAADKSKNSHAISDLGLSITKRIIPQEEDLSGLTVSFSLPSNLYKPYEKKDNDDSPATEEQTWLADENVLVQLEAVRLKTEEKVNDEKIAEDEPPKDDEIENDEADFTLVTMMNIIRSKKGKKIKSLPDEAQNAENDVDASNMVRKINLETNKFHLRNGHKQSPDKMGTEREKRTKRKIGDATSVPAPKRRRSKLLSSDSDDESCQKRVSLFDFNERNSKHEDKTVKGLVCGLAASGVFGENKRSSSKQKARGSGYIEENETSADSKKRVTLMETEKNPESPTGSAKKRKRKGISGLTKCLMMEGKINLEDLIGYRIKIWWPVDKKFYEGTIKSYDDSKRKHVILYDDGDVEILRLDKERWEVVDSGSKRAKKSNLFKGSPRKAVSSGKKTGTSGGSLQRKKPNKTVRVKRTPKKNLKNEQKSASNLSDPETKEDSGASDSTPTREFMKPTKLDSDDSEEEQAEMADENLGDKEEEADVSDTAEKSYSGHGFALESSSEELQKSDHEEEVQSAESKEQEKSGSEGSKKGEDADNQDESLEISDISDDETLSNWKRKVGKCGKLANTNEAAVHSI
ncbi:hypothetical protein ACFE04_030121 [Oxalis oulophora]